MYAKRLPESNFQGSGGRMDPADDNNDILDISFDDEDSEKEQSAAEEASEDDILEVSFDEEPTEETGDEEPYEQPPDVCPNCGYDLMPLETVCPRCGYDTRTGQIPGASEADTDEPQSDADEQIPAPGGKKPSGCSASPCLIVGGCMLAVILVISAAVFFGARHLISQYGSRLGDQQPQNHRPYEQTPADGPVMQLDSTNVNTHVLQSRGWALVDFGADWCAPCRILEPVSHELAAEYERRIRFYSVDTDVSPKLAGRYVGRGIPTLVMFHNGRQVATKVGSTDKQSLRSWIHRITR